MSVLRPYLSTLQFLPSAFFYGTDCKGAMP